MVFHEPDERFWVGVGRTRSNRFVIIDAGSSITTEVRFADATDPAAEFPRSCRAARASSTPSSTPSSAGRTAS